MLEVRETASEGRALALADQQRAEAGALLLAEEACVFTVCHYCLEALPPYAGIPCQACPLAWYCCAQHRALDAHHGGASCGVPWPVLLPEQLVLATRLAVVAQVTSRDLVAGLETHVGDVPSHQLFQEAVMCFIAAACAGLEPQLVLKAYRQVVINAIAITPAEHASAEDRMGLAIYPRAAMLNHACSPNVAAAFAGTRLHICATSDLPPGTTLRFCYGPQAGESIREVRLRQLKEQYHFWCRCSACEASYSGVQEAAMIGMKCRLCNGPVVPSIGCGAEMSSEEQIERMARLSQADAAFASACLSLAQHSAVSAETLQSMHFCLEVQEVLLVTSNQVLGRTHDALARAYGPRGDTENAMLHAQKALDIVRSNYGDGHLVVAHQRRRLELLAAGL
ncbi:hypothetical protein COCSUDRAFT_83627 [Coccomyxa subellipsoidea C-169]|uniref:SET domain-containing protein n=1 Tax=Coccomyxa subellipsoidea (strain C-169) TaxID=574566 RepID=I0Z4Q1_COCSC|nr:hypothetical protein COCSUDRAFT_83627 [Coccomyxa subellipsoidea C-169]EIE25620.1 hypothetical protein COCSUDRAFT_83627 [Coccomyxa subellipsoidea C-169]|eukprot:XP_005650164.1 hypothetical protein COCSUDRAFT_83627 [Coccomyxa subellipsoidea C-169]